LEGSEEVIVMADQPIIAYAPIKRIIKQETSDEQEGNSIEEENWTLQVYTVYSLFLLIYDYKTVNFQLLEDSVVMADLVPIIAYPPIQRNIKLEIPDEAQEENNNIEEENLTLRVGYTLSLLISLLSGYINWCN